MEPPSPERRQLPSPLLPFPQTWCLPTLECVLPPHSVCPLELTFKESALHIPGEPGSSERHMKSAFIESVVFCARAQEGSGICAYEGQGPSSLGYRP